MTQLLPGIENKSISAVVFVFFLFFILSSSFAIIGPGERGILITLGKVEDKILGEGLSFKKPFVQEVQKMDVKTHKKEVSESAASRDLQIVQAVVAVNYNLDPMTVNKLYQEVGRSYENRIIDPSTHESVKAVAARYTAEELVTKREEVREDMEMLLRENLLEEGILVTELSIVNFDFSASFNDAIEAKVTAEQNALAAKNKLEQVKFEAQQRIEQAQGEAEAIKIQVEAINEQGGAEYVNLKAIEKWDGVLPKQMLSSVVPFVNIGE